MPLLLPTPGWDFQGKPSDGKKCCRQQKPRFKNWTAGLVFSLGYGTHRPDHLWAKFRRPDVVGKSGLRGAPFYSPVEVRTLSMGLRLSSLWSGRPKRLPYTPRLGGWSSSAHFPPGTGIGSTLEGVAKWHGRQENKQEAVLRQEMGPVHKR